MRENEKNEWENDFKKTKIKCENEKILKVVQILRRK